MSYQGKKNIPRITVSPGAAASLPLSLGPDAPRAGRLGSLVGSPGRQGDPGLEGGGVESGGQSSRRGGRH